MFDDVIKVSKQKVSPQLYAKQTDWSEKEKLISSHGHLHKDEFRKAPKETLNQIIMKDAKKRNIPAPGHYNMPPEKISGYGAVSQKGQ